MRMRKMRMITGRKKTRKYGNSGRHRRRQLAGSNPARSCSARNHPSVRRRTRQHDDIKDSSMRDAASSSPAELESLEMKGGREAQPGNYIPLSFAGTAAAVVIASNERATLNSVVEELIRLPLQEIIVVLNGCSDGSFSALEHHPRLIKLSFPERLGHDVGRALGAAMTNCDSVLFVDGDLPVAAEDLAPFLLAIEQGSDVALNDITPFLPSFMKQDAVTYSKMFLNMALGRRDLLANSLTAVPHALSRKALNTLGHTSLIVPPKAHALALLHGLTVTAPHSVNVVKKNRIRSTNTGPANAVAGLINGDHVEALAEVMKACGTRLNFTRLTRGELAKVRNGC